MRDRTPEEQKKYDEMLKRRAEMRKIDRPDGYLVPDGYMGLVEMIITPNFKRLREKFGPVRKHYRLFATEDEYLEWYKDNLEG